ncbi:DUF982 domain-containing protein [Rhizobium grahamii]|nr:DUF982 domain-containing protein [Rhizobium grahamii]RDJ03031.1 hypothetical protein B5K06_31620 [Rhizobium grahamii]
MLVMCGPQKYLSISSLRHVAEALILAWPSDDGDEYVSAVKACLDAIEGRVPALEARGALIRAADEAGIPVITVVPYGDAEPETEGLVMRK